MSTIEQHVDVDVPVRTAYNQWTQFEDFPHFMEGVERIEQLDDSTTRWHVDIAGVEREFDADITEQRPDERIAWHSRGETQHAGVVTFHRLDEDRTRVTLQLEIQPGDWVEKAADALNVVDARTKGDMKRFKDFIESRDGRETGAWRGEIDQSATN